MKSKITLLAFLLWMPFIHLANAQSTDEIMTEFFNRYQKSPNEGLDYGFSTNTWIGETNQAGISNVKLQINNAVSIMGEYFGYEKYAELMIGKSLKQVKYMVKYDRQPLRFIFVFYKSSDHWKLLNFNFDDKISEDFK